MGGVPVEVVASSVVTPRRAGVGVPCEVLNVTEGGYGPTQPLSTPGDLHARQGTQHAVLDALMEQVDAFEPDLVIVDTLASAASLDENDARSVEEF